MEIESNNVIYKIKFFNQNYRTDPIRKNPKQNFIYFNDIAE